jgi:protein Mpv17
LTPDWASQKYSMFGRDVAAPLFATARSFIQRNPILFNGVTGGTLCALSDVGAQRLERTDETAKPFHIRRVVSAAILGFVFGGFVYPVAYNILDSRFHAKNLQTLFTKSLIEIATVGITVNTISMTCRGLLVGQDTQAVVKHVVKEIPKVTLNDVKVWLPYNLLAFSVIPPMIRPTTTAMMEASWQTYISLRSNDYEKRASKVISNGSSLPIVNY